MVAVAVCWFICLFCVGSLLFFVLFFPLLDSQELKCENVKMLLHRVAIPECEQSKILSLKNVELKV